MQSWMLVTMSVLYGHSLTLRKLSGQRRRDGHKVVVSAAVVHRHQPALPQIVRITVALCHKQVQRKATVHQHSCHIQRAGHTSEI